jgi:hypothetical protein
MEIELEYCCDNNADQPAEEVTEDECAWLCQWYIDSSVAENCRSALSDVSTPLFCISKPPLTKEATMGGTRRAVKYSV